MAIEVIDGFKVSKNVPVDTVREVVQTLEERDRIPASVRYEGMETRVIATKTKYVLEGGITNAHWKPMVNSSIPDYAFSSLNEIRMLDVSAINGAVDVWLYPARVYEWDAFSLLADNNDTIIKPNVVADDAAGRFVLRTELEVKNHIHLPNPGHYANGIDVENGKVGLGGSLRKQVEIDCDTLFNVAGSKFNSQIKAVVRLADGRFLVGGTFTNCNGISTPYLARLNADGTLDETLNFYVDGQVRGIKKLASGKLIVYGGFLSVVYFSGEEIATGQMCRLNADCTVDETFAGPDFDNYQVTALEEQTDGKLIVGGTFLGRIMRLHADGSEDTTYAVGSKFTGTGGVNVILRLDNDQMVVGGRFTAYNGTPASNLVLLDADGNRIGTIGSKALLGTVWALAKTSTGDVLVGGSFVNYNSGLSSYNLVKISVTGEVDTGFQKTNLDGITTDGIIYGFTAIDEMGTKFLVHGNFQVLNGTASMKVGIINASGLVNLDGFKSPFASTYTGTVMSGSDVNGFFMLGDSAGRLLAIKGNGDNYIKLSNLIFRNAPLQYDRDLSMLFDNLSLIHKGYLMQLIAGFINDAPADTSHYLRRNNAWEIFKVINGLVYENGQMRLGGELRYETILNNLKTKNLFVNGFTIHTSMLTMLSVGVLSNGDYLFAGRNLIYNGVPVPTYHLAKVNRFGVLDASFNKGNTGTMGSTEISQLLVLPDDRIVIHGGQYYNKQWRNSLSIINPDGSLDPLFNVTVNCTQPSIGETLFRSDDGYLIVAANIGNGAVVRKINEKTGATHAAFEANSGTFSNVKVISKHTGNKILVGGGFTAYKGINKGGLLRLNADGTLDGTFNPGGVGFDSDVHVILPLSSGGILVGGWFEAYNGVPVPEIVKLDNNGALDSGFNLPFENKNGGSLNVFKELPGGKILIGGGYTTSDGKSYLRVYNSDGTLASTFNNGCVNGFVSDVLVCQDKLVVVGQFTQVFNGTSWSKANGVVNLDLNGMPLLVPQKFAISGSPIEYNEDQSANFHERSLVDKGFVVSQLADRVRKIEFKGMVLTQGIPLEVIHNLGIRAVRVTVYDESTWGIVACQVVCADVTKVVLTPSANVAAATIVIEG
jgi:uncharacterized delta-60 repeat protein